MKKLIILATLLCIGASSSFAGHWGITASNGTQVTGSVTIPTAGTYTMNAYATAGFAVASFVGSVMDYPGYPGQQYKTGSLPAGTYSGEVSSTYVSGYNNWNIASITVDW